MAEARKIERVLAETACGGEQRRVSLVMGESLGLVERSSGPQTQVAYGARSHGHKMLCAHEACARVLDVGLDAVEQALAGFFCGKGEPLLLSDLMDRFDEAGERYAYMAWSGAGDLAFRPDAAVMA